MRKINVLTFLTLDGVMQAPGGPEEDPSENFPYGGWLAPYFDEFVGKIMQEQISRPFDLLLGRKTFEIFATYWPQAEGGKNPINEIKKLKQQDGPDLQVHGSSNLIQTLLAHDLVDELWLKIFPVTVGTGKRLFEEGTLPASYILVETQSSPSGVMIATYKRAGELKTGSVV